MERRRRHFLPLLSVFFLASCSLFVPRLFSSGPPFLFSPLCPNGRSEEEQIFFSVGGAGENPEKEMPLSCSAVPENSICCDRSHFRADVCVLRGDVRTSSSNFSIFLYSGGGAVNNTSATAAVQMEKIRPYTRKWEASVMSKIDELDLVVRNSSGGAAAACDVVHGVPAVVFSTGGYTGNVYHEFNDGIIPLYLTSLRFNRQVVFLILDYRPWWISKYRDILPLLSDYPPINFSGDNRTHCFPEVTVGLRIHGELSIDPSLTNPRNLTIFDFRRFLDNAFFDHIRYLVREVPRVTAPKLVIMFRNGSRAVENEDEVVALCEKVGFQVQVMRPDETSELAEMYRDLNSSDAMMGVVGCALTHLLFMKPGDVFLQIVPLGTEWGAEANFGGPATAMGLKYIPYRIKISESSLSRIYDKDDPVLTNPEALNRQGWDQTKRVYLGNQTVRVDLQRFVDTLTTAYKYIVDRKKKSTLREE